MNETNSKRQLHNVGASVRFDGSSDRLDRSIQKRMENADYLGALRLTNRRNEFFPATVDSYAAQADIYEYLEASSQALKTWYQFLCICEEEDLSEAYEGIAVNYMNLGKESQAAYYYNLLLNVDDDITEESKMEIIERFSAPPKTGFRTVYPPEKADYAADVDRGLRALRENKLTAAKEAFKGVPRGAKQYRSAQNLLAVTLLLEDDKTEAKALCERLLKEDSDDVQTNTTYAAILGQEGETAKAKEIAQKLCKIPTDDVDELYKIATVCCENELHAEALAIFLRLETDIGNDKNLLYFKGVAAYKSGNLTLAIDTFERLLTIYPEAAVTRFYYDLLRNYRKNKDKTDVQPPELTYFYRIPQFAREKYCELLSFLETLGVKECAAVADNEQLHNVFHWCFDEMDGVDGDLQTYAMMVAVHCRYEKFIQDVLLNPDVSDVIKLKTLHLLAEQNREVTYGVVLYHIFRPIRFSRLKLGSKKKKKFLRGYASVYAKFVVVTQGHAQKINASAELLYNCLIAAEAESFIDSPENIACTIYMLAGIKEGGKTIEKASEIFGSNPHTVRLLLGLVDEVTAMIERKRFAENAKNAENAQTVPTIQTGETAENTMDDEE